ncbi:MAG: hypothetical protein AAFR28_18570, partial [Pseudomonadota bacterium]
MTLSFGRQFLAIPGPTTVPDEVLQAMHRPAIDIYAGELEGILGFETRPLVSADYTNDTRSG